MSKEKSKVLVIEQDKKFKVFEILVVTGVVLVTLGVVLIGIVVAITKGKITKKDLAKPIKFDISLEH